MWYPCLKVTVDYSRQNKDQYPVYITNETCMKGGQTDDCVLWSA